MSFEGYDAPTWRPGPAAVAMDALRSACVRQPILVAQKKIRLSLWCYYSTVLRSRYYLAESDGKTEVLIVELINSPTSS